MTKLLLLVTRYPGWWATFQSEVAGYCTEFKTLRVVGTTLAHMSLTRHACISGVHIVLGSFLAQE